MEISKVEAGSLSVRNVHHSSQKDQVEMKNFTSEKEPNKIKLFTFSLWNDLIFNASILQYYLM